MGFDSTKSDLADLCLLVSVLTERIVHTELDIYVFNNTVIINSIC
jgi:hypothetical protein